MTDQQARVFEALARGRLIFPFRDELRGLRDLAKSGPLTSDEQGRLTALDGAYQKIKAKDEWFHSAMLAGDQASAAKVAQDALAILKEVA